MIDRLVAPDPDFSKGSKRSSGRRGEPRAPRQKRPRRRGRLWLRLIGAAFAFMFVAGMVMAGALFVYVVRVTEDLPSIEDLADYEPPVMSRVQAGDGRLIAEYARESRVFVPIETVPRRVIDAFISAEDKNFYHHHGIEPVGMVRAQLRNIANMLRGVNAPLQGGSTITQQVAKNFKLDASQTVERKVREIALAIRIEQALTKDQILELYLNEIYLGRRAYGVAAAALLYFGKPLDELSLSEIAYLAALPRAPNNYHPIRNKDGAIERRNWVLDRMTANGYLSQAEADIAKRDDLVVTERLTGATYQAAEYFVEETRRWAFSNYGEEDLYDGGLSIRTTLDTHLQIAARRALRDGLEAYDRRHGYRGPITAIEPGEGWLDRLVNVESENIDLDPGWAKAVVLEAGDESARIGFLDGSEGIIPLSELTWARRVTNGRRGPQIEKASDALSPGEVVYAAPPPSGTGEDADGQFSLRQIPAVNGAIMAIDPHTGRVLAMVGGYSYRLSQFNRATQAQRQPGSSFKPFVYAAALDHGYTPVSKILDAPYVTLNGEDGDFYKPTNYENRSYGLTTLRRGVELSHNEMTLRLANAMGLNLVSEYGEKFGLYDDLPPYDAMAIGAGETTLWRMVTGYAEFVNGGFQVTPTIIDRVQDRDGRTIYRHDERMCTGCDVDPEVTDWADAPVPRLTDSRPRIEDPVTAYQVVSILQGVVDRGTGRSTVGVLDWPLAGKTGTTNDSKDAWFIGFSPDLVAGVYIGFDTPRSLGNTETGGVVAGPVFRDFMAEALKDAPKIEFRIPPGVRLVPVDAVSGALSRQGDPGMIWEAFKPGTEPTRFDAPDSDDYSPADDRARGGISVAGPFDSVDSPSAVTAASPSRGGGAGAVTFAPPAAGGGRGGAAAPSFGDPAATGGPASADVSAPALDLPPAGGTAGPATASETGPEAGSEAAPGDAAAPAESDGLGALLDRLQGLGDTEPSGQDGADAQPASEGAEGL